MSPARYPLLIFIIFLALSFAEQSPANDQAQQESLSPIAVDDGDVNRMYDQRAWYKAEELTIDPIEYANEASIPIEDAKAKIVGSSYENSVFSLAVKIWLIDHAEHSVDAGYYIFRSDLVGSAFLGALCQAVQRGVDVRMLVDSFGSIHPLHPSLKAFTTCADNAGQIINGDGLLTTRKARAQSVIFNAISKVFVNHNRRSHDKLLIVDGAFPDKSWIMTGGRNITLSYYGFRKDGSKDLSAYKDMEILVKPKNVSGMTNTVGQTTERYFDILFSHGTNKQLNPKLSYRRQHKKLIESLERIRQMPDFAKAYNGVPEYLFKDLHPAKIRLAHELGNLVNRNVVSQYDKNIQKNTNSIMGMVDRIARIDSGGRPQTIRLVSPYLFIAKYEREDGTVYYDGKEAIYEWLGKHPGNVLEIVTNSVLTSDNFFAQAFIDMDTAPRLLLTPEFEEQWQQPIKKSELNPKLVESAEWQEMISNPRIRIYQTGKIDSNLLGGEVAYGKLHAKFYLSDVVGFVGTTNLDYRSRLFNNEMGYFFTSEELIEDLIEEFETLKSQSYLWGSPEWLEMRAAVREKGGFFKSLWTKGQHSTFGKLTRTGLHWLF